MTLFQKTSLPILNSCTGVNPSPPSASYMCQWIGSALVQIMAFRLFGTEPLSEPIQGYCQLDSEEQSSVNFNQNTTLYFAKFHLWLPFCPGGLELTQWLLLFYHFMYDRLCSVQGHHQPLLRQCCYQQWAMSPSGFCIRVRECKGTIRIMCWNWYSVVTII